jgi:hypothetical protein
MWLDRGFGLVATVTLLVLTGARKRVAVNAHGDTSDASEPKVAFLFLVRRDIRHAETWEAFLRKFPDGCWSAYVHHKPGQEVALTRFFARRAIVVPDPIETMWKNFSLVLAQNLLMRTALSDPANFKFVFVSESCVPVKNPMLLYSALVGDPTSSFCNGQPRGQNRIPWQIIQNQTGRTVPFEQCNLHKAHQWSVIVRRHAQILIESEGLMRELGLDLLGGNQEGGAPDEYAYNTVLVHLGLAQQINQGLSAPVCNTFVFWELRQARAIAPTLVHLLHSQLGREKPRMPGEFSLVDSASLDELVESPFLFARKFANRVEVHSGGQSFNQLLTSKIGVGADDGANAAF